MSRLAPVLLGVLLVTSACERPGAKTAGRHEPAGEPESRATAAHDTLLRIDPEMMRDLAGHARLSVLTNKPEEPARRLLDAYNLTPHVAGVVGGDSGFARKPDPAGLRHLIDAGRS